ncbi:MAG: cell division protein MraZ [bacterium ADurb.Bin400]|nr:MAG: cell division protein MraZ [bacterium ADurb.Bin400]
MFIGEYTHSIDDKGRLALPVKFRSELEAGCVITRGLDGCLWIYSTVEWQNLAQKIAELPITQRDARSFSRLMLAGAMDSKLDKVGRINVPQYLKEYAGIEGKVVVAGMYNRLEIWPEDKWIAFKKEMEANSDKIAENLNEIGF